MCFTAISSPNQTLIGSNLATPQKQLAAKPGLTPPNQPRQQTIMPVPTARTPINVRSMPQSSSLITPSYGQYKLGSPTPVIGKQSHTHTYTKFIEKKSYCAHLLHFLHVNLAARHQFGTPFPIINQNQKGLFEKIVDYLINDGPSSRYGMICKECYGHNGKC